MITCLILIVAAVLVFAVYNWVMIARYSVPVSLSETFYLLRTDSKVACYCFTAMMWSVAFLLLPAWIEVSEAVGTWERYFTFLAFLAAAAICFVGGAPAFRELSIESKVHSISAKLAAFFALAWCLVVCWRIAYIVPVSCVVTLITAASTKTLKRCATYWLEMCAFVATFATLFVECLCLM